MKEFSLSTPEIESFPRRINFAARKLMDRVPCSDDKIIVSIPKYLIEFLHRYAQEETNSTINRNQILPYKIQASHENKIVVFFEDAARMPHLKLYTEFEFTITEEK